MFDITDFCRICTRAECTLIDLSSPDTDNIKLSEKLKYCIAESINDNEDVLPNLICDNCCKNLKTSYAFKKICIKTKTILCGVLNNDNIKNTIPIAFPKTNQLVIKQELMSDNEEDSHIDVEISEVFSDIQQKKTESAQKNCSKCGTRTNKLHELNNRKLCDSCLITCTKCSETFPNSAQLREHYEQQHISQLTSTKDLEVSYICSVCKFRYTSERLLAAHMRAHSGERPYKCNVCGERFAWQHHLRRHMQTQHASGTKLAFPCTVCPRSFPNVAKLQMHMRQHSGRRISDEVDEQVKREDGVTTDKTQLYCSVCSKVFYGRHKLMIHSRVHSGEKPFECTDCGKRFTQSGYLAYHARIHSGERPFVCTVCAKSFTQKTTLSTHMRVHLEKNPVECPICKKRVSYQCTLRRHMKMVHGVTEDGEADSNNVEQKCDILL